MPVTVRGTDILFNDATTQSTAATAASLVTTANVLNATAGAAVYAIGTYISAIQTSSFGSTINPGVTVAGSTWLASGTYVYNVGGFGEALYPGYNSGTGALPGTWRNMGYLQGTTNVRMTLLLRIS